MLKKVEEKIVQNSKIPRNQQKIDSIIDGFIRRRCNSGGRAQTEEDEKIKKNLFKTALLYSKELFKDSSGTGIISVDEICVIHRKLMRGLRADCGNFRKTEAYAVTPRDDEKYYYTNHSEIEKKLFTVIDHHNTHMEQLDSSLSMYDKLVTLVKCAAWLLFNFVDIHPFGDGNGRMCRLLAAYTMMVMTPFPVHVYYVNPEEGSSMPSRDDYMSAIVSCRQHPKKEPSMIAALLVDGLYYGWINYLDNS